MDDTNGETDGSDGTDTSTSSTSATTQDTSASTSTGDDATGTATGTETSTDDATTTGPTQPPSGHVDILFVVDNTGSLGASQRLLAEGISALTDVLMDNSIGFRIGITTTDNGNPWCTGTSPEGGALRLSSCRSRQSDFVFNGAQMVDVTQEACLDVCALDELDITPTPTDVDPEPKPRPWVEWNAADGDNIGGMDPATILACALPQGINGCGFEQPLESMYKAVQRMMVEDQESYGFLRADANLVIVFVTDEVDCSHNQDHQIIFLPEGNRVFWSNPDEGSPTSAVCWNAGVACTGGPGTYDECHAENYDVDGTPNAADADAVIRPLSRYTDFLAGLGYDDGRYLKVFGITGVPIDGGDPVYADSMDPQYQADFGIGAGCTSNLVQAVPPVRLRELAITTNGSLGDGLSSICAASYGPAFTAMADEVVTWAQP